MENFKIENYEDYEVSYLEIVLEEAKNIFDDIEIVYEYNKKRITFLYQILLPLTAGTIALIFNVDVNNCVLIFLLQSLLFEMIFIIWLTRINKFRQVKLKGVEPYKYNWKEISTIHKTNQTKKLLVSLIESYQSKCSFNLNINDTVGRKIKTYTEYLLIISYIQILNIVLVFILSRLMILCDQCL